MTRLPTQQFIYQPNMRVKLPDGVYLPQSPLVGVFLGKVNAGSPGSEKTSSRQFVNKGMAGNEQKGSTGAFQRARHTDFQAATMPV